MNRSETIDKIATALAAAQKIIKSPAKTKTAKIQTKGGAAFSYSYCDLADVLDAIREPFAANGLSLIQPIEIEDNHMVLSTYLLHTSGT